MPDIPGLGTPTVAPRAGTGGGRVGWGFISLYTLAYMSTCLVLLAPLLVSLALKVNSFVGTAQAPTRLALVTGVGALVAMFGNPLFGKISDRTTSRLGMRRPWMVIGLVGGSVGILTVALAPNVVVVLAGWCVAQLFFNALLAAMVAVLPDHVPAVQRGLVSGVLGVCLPVASVSGTYLVQLFAGNEIAMLLVPCAIGGFFILLFAATLQDRQLTRVVKPTWSMREVARTFYVVPRKSPDFAWAFVSRFMFVLAYAFLVTYQAYYLLDKIGSAKADVPHQIFLGTLAQSAVIVAASLIGGRLPTGRAVASSSSSPLPSSTAWRSSSSPSPAISTVSSSAWPSPGSVSGCTWPSTLRSSPTCCPTNNHRQGSRRLQHRRRAALLRCAGDRPGHPGDRRRQLRRAVCGRRSLRAHRSRRHPSGERCPLAGKCRSRP